MGHYGRKPNRMTDSASGEYIRLYTSMIFIIVIRHKKKSVGCLGWFGPKMSLLEEN